MGSHLFLTGGFSLSTFKTVSQKFINAAGNEQARIALLKQHEKDWREKTALFVDIWQSFGAKVLPIAVDEKDKELTQSEMTFLKSATGFYVGGGDPGYYHQHYVASKIGAIIKSAIKNGAPYAGQSAGAMVASDKIMDEGNSILKGFGFLENTIIFPHFTPEDKAEMYAEIELANVATGIGIPQAGYIEIKGNQVIAYSESEKIFYVKQEAFGKIGTRKFAQNIRL